MKVVTSEERISISEDGSESFSRKALLTVLDNGRVRLAVGLDDRSYAILLDRETVNMLATWLSGVAAKENSQP